MKIKQKNLLFHVLLSVWLLLMLVQICCNLPTLRQPGDWALLLEQTIQQPVDQKILQDADPQRWMRWIEELSGEKPVIINGQEIFLRSRYSYAMFLDYPEAQVMPYLLEQILQYVPLDQIEIDPYPYVDAEQNYTWQNLIVRLPGKTSPDEKILLTAHFDSIVVRDGNALLVAPGADDNASGTAVLLEALHLLADESFEKTIEIIFFSGEELSLQGSRAYVQDHDLQGVQAVLNVDMIGYDSDDDGCFEIHAGTDPASQQIAVLLSETIVNYQIPLQPEILLENATERSDHAPFWNAQIPAIAISENFFEQQGAGVCPLNDPNPYYHQSGDLAANININYGYNITQAVILTVAALAVPY
jgi:leucyl aminopeptidase